MKIHKIIYFPTEPNSVNQFSDLRTESEFFSNWNSIKAQISLEKAPSRNIKDQLAYWVVGDISDDSFIEAIPGFPAKDSQFIFLNSALEHGWELLPDAEDTAYLYGEYKNGDLESVLKFDGEIRRYKMRSQLMPNITRRFTRFVVLFPDIISFIEESNQKFPHQCYVLSLVCKRAGGVFEDLAEIAKLNDVQINTMDDYITLMEKTAGKEIILPNGKFSLEPILYPVFR